MVAPRSTVAVLTFLLSIPCCGQAEVVTPQTLNDLKATRWQVRRNAFEHLSAMPDVTDRKDTQTLLIDLRERENDAANSEAEDLFEDDDYLAYDEELTPLVQKIALKTHQPRAWKALVYSRYNGDSVYGNWLADHREALPFLIRQLRSPFWARRMYAVYVISNMLAKSKTNESVSSAQYCSLKARIRRDAMHDVGSVSQTAIEGLGLTRDAEDVPFLERLARRSKNPYVKKLASETAQRIKDAKS